MKYPCSLRFVAGEFERGIRVGVLCCGSARLAQHAPALAGPVRQGRRRPVAPPGSNSVSMNGPTGAAAIAPPPVA